MPPDVAYLNALVDAAAAATAANRATPGRRGSVAYLDADRTDAVVVAGDLHGQRGHFNKIVKAAGLAKHPRRHLVLQEVVHGGPAYPNGGCISHALLEAVIALKAEFPERFHFLLCNHELAQATNQAIVKSGVSQNLLYSQGLEHAYGLAAGTIAAAQREFILSCPLAVRLPNGVLLAHTLPEPAAFKAHGVAAYLRDLRADDFATGAAAHAAVWGRNYAPTHVAAFLEALGATLLVSGHEPTPEGFRLAGPRQLILDASRDHCQVAVLPAGSTYAAADIAAKLHRL